MATLRELIIKVSANSQSFQTEIARASRMGSDYYKTMQRGGRQAAVSARETRQVLAEVSAQLSVQLWVWLVRLPEFLRPGTLSLLLMSGVL